MQPVKQKVCKTGKICHSTDWLSQYHVEQTCCISLESERKKSLVFGWNSRSGIMDGLRSILNFGIKFALEISNFLCSSIPIKGCIVNIIPSQNQMEVIRTRVVSVSRSCCSSSFIFLSRKVLVSENIENFWDGFSYFLETI